MKNKVLFLIKIPPPITGATLMNFYISESQLLKNDFECIMKTISFSNSVQELGKFSFIKVVKFFRYLFSVLNLLATHDPDLVYVQLSPVGFAFIRDAFLIKMIKANDRKIVLHLHGKGIVDYSKNAVYRLLYKNTFKDVSIICLSKILITDLESVYKGRPYIVPNGIPWLPHAKEFKREIRQKKMNILFLSNLILEKGILDFIESLEIIQLNGIDFQGNIVGSQADITTQSLQNLILAKNLEKKVQYHGPKYGEAKSLILMEADILIFPTYYKNETFGLVILEAMQFSIPVICTNEGSIPEIIEDNRSGFIVPKTSPEEIAKKIQFLYENPAIRLEMGANARAKYLEYYNLDVFENNLKATINSVLKNDI